MVEKRVSVIKNEAMSSEPENKKKRSKQETTWVGVWYRLKLWQGARTAL